MFSRTQPRHHDPSPTANTGPDSEQMQTPSVLDIDGGRISPPPLKKRKNAFTELMSPKKTPVSPTPNPPSSSSGPGSGSKRHTSNLFHGKSALQSYITSPLSFSSQIVLRHSTDFVVIRDAFPKSSVHLLILPRDAAKSVMHPFQAFEDGAFLEKVRREAKAAIDLVASELKDRFGSSSSLSSSSSKKEGDAENEGEKQRDWTEGVLVGVHAVPSMSHLHIHVLSPDRRSECVKHRKHYNSFSTPFFVSLDDFPLAEDDERREPTRMGYLKREFVCWRCGVTYGNKFKELKTHLEDEFVRWKVDG